MNPKLDSEAPIGTVAPDFPELIAMFDRFSSTIAVTGRTRSRRHVATLASVSAR